jgi:hypothetical protein
MYQLWYIEGFLHNSHQISGCTKRLCYLIFVIFERGARSGQRNRLRVKAGNKAAQFEENE